MEKKNRTEKYDQMIIIYSFDRVRRMPKARTISGKNYQVKKMKHGRKRKRKREKCKKKHQESKHKLQ